jgi:hypothetical protein
MKFGGRESAPAAVQRSVADICEILRIRKSTLHVVRLLSNWRFNLWSANCQQPAVFQTFKPGLDDLEPVGTLSSVSLSTAER